MAGWDLSVDELLETARILAYEPSSGGRFEDAEILRVANLLNLSYAYPLLRKISEEYYITKFDQSPVGNQSEYEIPEDAYGATLRDVTWLDDSGNGYSMTWYPLEDIDFYGGSGAPGAPPSFAIEGRNIVLLPAPVSSSGTLRLRFQRRPNKMVRKASAGRITGVAGGVLTGSFPATWTTADRLCVVRGDGTFDTLVGSFGASAVSAVEITATTAADVEDVAANDWVALKDETPFPQLPEPMHLLLARRIAFECLLATGDTRADAVDRALSRDEAQAVTTLAPRVKGETFRIVNWSSHLRRTSRPSFVVGGWTR
jgi:hypothetical protein